ncbi:MAG: formate--tetrahydrofolate ligase [Planctomycetes bacterium GWF2_50_10]|nr:MAG: formate--tetrahydrofolate ligase [Planctomycetes bacterium GWF2_50_10]
MGLDPTKMKDWEIAEAAEAGMKPIGLVAAEMGIEENEIIPMGRNVAKIDFEKVMARTSERSDFKYVDVTAITPTPLGEGKTTTTMGLIQGLGRLGKKVSGAIRQPSAGPTFNVKGSAAGGGLAQCIPLAPFSIRLTGDIDSVTNANNLAMVALTARMQHERNYDDAKLEKLGLKRLDIDPARVQMKWAMDFCAQSLRNIVIGKGGDKDGFEMDSGFAISVSSEVMAILAVSRDLRDMRERMGRIVVAYSKSGREVTARDLEVDGAMTAWMLDAINPNLLQTIEGQPVLVHAGPFANIAIGQSSIIADRLASRLMEYHVTESGFAADIGFEKFWNLKCRMSGLRPSAVVIVATIRALKMHGGGPAVKPGVALNEAYTKENLGLVEKGFENLAAHIEIVKQSGVRPIVCINSFYTDTKAEVELVRKLSGQAGAMCALSEHWLKGGEGAVELAEAVVAACEAKHEFKYLYELDAPLRTRIELIAKGMYGADGVDYTDDAGAKLKLIDADPASKTMGTCMVKTHLSLSDNPDVKGRPKGWRLKIRDIMVFKGAGFVVPVAGDIKLMPGTASNPGFRRVDVDVKTGRVVGLF